MKTVNVPAAGPRPAPRAAVVATPAPVVGPSELFDSATEARRRGDYGACSTSTASSRPGTRRAARPRSPGRSSAGSARSRRPCRRAGEVRFVSRGRRGRARRRGDGRTRHGARPPRQDRRGPARVGGARRGVSRQSVRRSRESASRDVERSLMRAWVRRGAHCRRRGLDGVRVRAERARADAPERQCSRCQSRSGFVARLDAHGRRHDCRRGVMMPIRCWGRIRESSWSGVGSNGGPAPRRRRVARLLHAGVPASGLSVWIEPGVALRSSTTIVRRGSTEVRRTIARDSSPAIVREEIGEAVRSGVEAQLLSDAATSATPPVVSAPPLAPVPVAAEKSTPLAVSDPVVRARFDDLRRRRAGGEQLGFRASHRRRRRHRIRGGRLRPSSAA